MLLWMCNNVVRGFYEKDDIRPNIGSACFIYQSGYIIVSSLSEFRVRVAGATKNSSEEHWEQ